MKLISPLIATVLLVILTVGIALALWFYLNTYIGTQTSQIPTICQANVQFEGKYNFSLLTFKINHIAGEKVRNVTLNLVCSSPSNQTKIFLKEEFTAGEIISNKTEFICNSIDDLAISISGICNDRMGTLYECSGKRCNIKLE